MTAGHGRLPVPANGRFGASQFTRGLVRLVVASRRPGIPATDQKRTGKPIRKNAGFLLIADIASALTSTGLILLSAPPRLPLDRLDVRYDPSPIIDSQDLVAETLK